MADRLEAELSIQLGGLQLQLSLRARSPAVALVGPSGAGKSTALRIFAGLERRARGWLAFGAQRWQDRGLFVPPHRRGVGWVPQDACLFPHLSVRDNLGYARAPEAEIQAVAERLSVQSLLERRPRHLSGGERQRVALGRALLARPRLLLLDEPFAALDAPLRVRLAADLASLCRERALPLVVVSHHEDDVEILADEVWLLSGGQTRPR
ncbi:MAG TPA: ATP-binding cassette domain-containing protein [Deltaproteobacteria bacterium]|nr:ATP-binding cassette domain-containing protein [Deltaproteobacteria bacterium]